MTIQQAPAPTEAEPEAEFVPLHEDDYRSEELTEKFGEEIWIHKPTGRPYFPNDELSQSWTKLPVLDHDHPFLKFLRGEIDL